MKSLLLVVLIILCCGIVTFLIWNIVLYNKLPKKLKSSSKEYYELKYQQQFYVAIFATIIAAFSIFGWDKYNEIEKTITRDISLKTDSIISSSTKELTTKLTENQRINEDLKRRYDEIFSKSERTDEAFSRLYNDFFNFRKDLLESQIQLKTQISSVEYAGQRLIALKKDVEELKKVDFLNQVYLVTDRYFEPEDALKVTDTVYFKDLKTINKNSLPIFNSSPSILVSSYSGLWMNITKVTSEYYIMNGGGGNSYTDELDVEDPKNWKYDILIIYKEKE